LLSHVTHNSRIHCHNLHKRDCNWLYIFSGIICGADYPSHEREILPAARTAPHQGASILPAARTTRIQGLKGGYFVVVWGVESMNLTLA
jgi:hypothetical protein